MNSKTLLCTVVYPQAEKHLVEFLTSISNQDLKDFDFIIFNDGCEKLDNYLSYLTIDYIVISRNIKQTPALIRQDAIRYATQNQYDNFIFADSDDICLNNKVSVIVKALNFAGVVFHDMKLINNNSTIIKNSYYQEIMKMDKISYLDLFEQNYVGLSNMGVKVKYLKYCLPIPEKIIAVDWWIAFNILYYIDFASFIEEPLTLYRQHNQNLTGFNTAIDKICLIKALEVKKIHYYYLLKKFESLDQSISKTLHKKYNEILNFENFIKTKRENFESALSVINNYKSAYAWWEFAIGIKKMEEMRNEIYKNQR